MAVTLLFLGRLADVAGAPERQVAATGDLAELIASLEPELAEALSSRRTRIAINGVVVQADTASSLKDGDDIAFLPPVSGG